MRVRQCIVSCEIHAIYEIHEIGGSYIYEGKSVHGKM